MCCPCCSFWNVDIRRASEPAIRAHLEFIEDPKDPNGLVSDVFQYMPESSRRQIRETADDPNGEKEPKVSAEGAEYVGRVEVKLHTAESGKVSFKPVGEVCSRRLPADLSSLLCV